MYRLGSDDILIGKYTEEYNFGFEKKLSCIHLKQEENTRRHIPENKALKHPTVTKYWKAVYSAFSVDYSSRYYVMARKIYSSTTSVSRN